MFTGAIQWKKDSPDHILGFRIVLLQQRISQLGTEKSLHVARDCNPDWCLAWLYGSHARDLLDIMPFWRDLPCEKCSEPVMYQTEWSFGKTQCKSAVDVFKNKDMSLLWATLSLLSNPLCHSVLKTLYRTKLKANKMSYWYVCRAELTIVSFQFIIYFTIITNYT